MSPLPGYSSGPPTTEGGLDGSDSAQVSHPHLVLTAVAVERRRRVEHDVVRVEAHARVEAATLERNRLLLDRLHEGDVANVRVEVDVGVPVAVARALQRVHAQVR